MSSLLHARRPIGDRWSTFPVPAAGSLRALDVAAWQRGPISVISALEMAEYPDRDGTGPQWHISISRRGMRPTPLDVSRALRAFDLIGAEEDNHHPGNARHFWLPVDPAHRVDCECKETEVTVIEPDGYQWQNDREKCRGCELQRLIGRLCPLHMKGAELEKALERREP